MKQITNDLNELETKLHAATTFLLTFGDKINGQLSVTSLKLYIHSRDCAHAGDVFGRSGWTREVNYGNSFDWHKKVQDITVIIDCAEKNQFNKTPVNPKDFPIQLEDTTTNDD